MEETGQVAIFWDYENCAAPSSLSGYELVKRIREVAHEFGNVKLLKAYTELSEKSMNSSRSIALRSELQSSGVSMTDCPHNGHKNVADQMIIADMLTFAMDNPTNPSNTTIILMSGDRDFSYPLSVLRLRRYHVVVVAPSAVHPSLRAQATRFFEWSTSILTRDESHSYLNSTFQSARGQPRTYGYTTPSSSATASSMSRSTFLTLDTNQASCAPSSSSGSGLPSPKSKLLRPPLSHLPVASPTAISSSAAPTGSPPEYSDSVAANILGPNRNWRDIARASNGQSSLSTLRPRPSITTCLPTSPNDTKLTVPKPVLNSSPTLPHAPLPSFARPNSAGPCFSGTNSLLVLDSPQTSLETSLARPTAGNALKALSPLISSKTHPATTPASTYDFARPAQLAEAGSTLIASTAGNHVNSLSGGVKLSTPSPPPGASLGRRLATNGPEPAQSQSVGTGSTLIGASGGCHPRSLSGGVKLSTSALSSGDKPANNVSELATITPAAASVPPADLPPLAAPAPPLKSIPQSFLLLVQHLEQLRLNGILSPQRSVVSIALVKADQEIYRRTGCTKWKDFADEAERLGLIILGGDRGTTWVKLHPTLQGRIELKKS